jgi:hypothetical protein
MKSLHENHLRFESYLRDLSLQPTQPNARELHFSMTDIVDPDKASGSVPKDTVAWLRRHPGFTTRRVPIRDWMTTLPTRETVIDEIARLRRNDWDYGEGRDWRYRY